MMTCLLGDDVVPSYEDTCSFTCNNGYELTGSNTRTCQGDGIWSGSDDMCRKSMYVYRAVSRYLIYECPATRECINLKISDYLMGPGECQFGKK